MFCPNCGKEQVDSPNFCQNCGCKQIQGPVLQPEVAIPIEAATPAGVAIPVSVIPVEYAGFWRRVGAFFIDWFLMNIVTLVAIFIIEFTIYFSFLRSDSGVDEVAVDNAVTLIGLLASLGICWFYHVLMESSSRQATLGKMALGIIVTDSQGKRISFGKATGRYFAKFISWLILGFGFLLIAFTGKKQGLHDMMADTLIVRK